MDNKLKTKHKNKYKNILNKIIKENLNINSKYISDIEKSINNKSLLNKAEAYYCLGYSYLNGIGCEINEQTAIQYLNNSQNEPKTFLYSKILLAEYYLKTKTNYKLAEKFLKYCSDNNFVLAKYELALIYFKGYRDNNGFILIEQNIQNSIKLFHEILKLENSNTIPDRNKIPNSIIKYIKFLSNYYLILIELLKKTNHLPIKEIKNQITKLLRTFKIKKERKNFPVWFEKIQKEYMIRHNQLSYYKNMISFYENDFDKTYLNESLIEFNELNNEHEKKYSHNFKPISVWNFKKNVNKFENVLDKAKIMLELSFADDKITRFLLLNQLKKLANPTINFECFKLSKTQDENFFDIEIIVNNFKNYNNYVYKILTNIIKQNKKYEIGWNLEMLDTFKILLGSNGNIYFHKSNTNKSKKNNAIYLINNSIKTQGLSEIISSLSEEYLYSIKATYERYASIIENHSKGDVRRQEPFPWLGFPANVLSLQEFTSIVLSEVNAQIVKKSNKKDKVGFILSIVSISISSILLIVQIFLDTFVF